MNWRSQCNQVEVPALFLTAEALLHSSAPIDAIAVRVGYASKEALSRAFQSKYGEAPSAWRASRNSAL